MIMIIKRPVSDARTERVAAVTALVAENPHLADVPVAGVVLAECALGFA